MVTAAKLSPDGLIVATTDDDGILRLYNRDLSPVGALRGHFGPLNDLAWCPNSRTLATVGADKLCILWDIQQLKAVATLRGHTHEVTSACFTPKGTIVATTSIDESVRLWNVQSGQCLHILSAHTEVVSSCDVSHDGTLIVTGAADGLIRIWDTQSGICLKTLDSGSKVVTSARFTPNARFVAASTSDGMTRIWDYVDVVCAKEFVGDSGPHSRSVVFDGDKVYVAGPKEVSIYNLQTMERVGGIPLVAYTLEVHGQELLTGGPSGVKWVSSK